jgi:hypothetical protein
MSCIRAMTYIDTRFEIGLWVMSTKEHGLGYLANADSHIFALPLFRMSAPHPATTKFPPRMAVSRIRKANEGTTPRPEVSCPRVL